MFGTAHDLNIYQISSVLKQGQVRSHVLGTINQECGSTRFRQNNIPALVPNTLACEHDCFLMEGWGMVSNQA